MAFSISESVSNAAHRSLALTRIIGRLDIQHHISKKNKAGLGLKAVFDKSGKPRTCQLCGFALATLELNEQWLMQSCSATGFKETGKQPGFAAWLRRLSEGQDGEKSEKTKQYSDVSP
ncbi:MAG: hypothetical protein C5B53_03750 [Candidatus Melainabacteria bacterium]|nr:MAG: hypothetical protein C5B53_03750 [Candidatus Melainabacteria bacterium]